MLNTTPIIALNFQKSLLEIYPVEETIAAGPAEYVEVERYTVPHIASISTAIIFGTPAPRAIDKNQHTKLKSELIHLGTNSVSRSKLTTELLKLIPNSCL